MPNIQNGFAQNEYLLDEAQNLDDANTKFSQKR